jgi:hypothetical protein
VIKEEVLMVDQAWEAQQIMYCERTSSEVQLEVKKLYPPEVLGVKPARITSHRCSNGQECMMFGQAGCTWSGSNPDFDPFRG